MEARYRIVIYCEVTPEDGFIITACISSDVSNLIKGGVWRRARGRGKLQVG
jgi:ribonuclease PH